MVSDYTFGGNGRQIMPFYLICDVSSAMYRETTALHEGVSQLWDYIASWPILDDVTRVCILTFADSADVLVSLVRTSVYRTIPQFRFQNLARYGAAFHAVADAMERDYRALRKAKMSPYRPCVYFLTNTEPSDHDWRETFKATLAQDAMDKRHVPVPVFVPFGFRDAQQHVLRRLAYPPGVSRWYHAESAVFEEALDGLLEIIQSSVEKSSQSSLYGRPEHVFPEPRVGSGITSHVAE